MILVTGATGMTGQFVVAVLQQRSYPVRALVREESVDKAPPGVDIAIGDLTDAVTLQRATNGVTGIIHTACTFTDSSIDIAAMQTLLAHWEAGPFIFVSSLDVYGFPKRNPVTEAHPLSETYGDYGRCKVICERLLVEQAVATERTDYVLLRAPHILGPHPKMRRRFLRQVMQGEPITLPGADETEWSKYRDAWIDVRDLARVIVESLLKPIGGPLNVLSDHFIWHEFYAEIIRLTSSSSQLIQQPRADYSEEAWQKVETLAQSWHFDNHKLRQHLAFTPQYTLSATLEVATVSQ